MQVLNGCIFKFGKNNELYVLLHFIFFIAKISLKSILWRAVIKCQNFQKTWKKYSQISVFFFIKKTKICVRFCDKKDLRHLYVWFLCLSTNTLLSTIKSGMGLRLSEIYILSNNRWKCVNIKGRETILTNIISQWKILKSQNQPSHMKPWAMYIGNHCPF